MATQRPLVFQINFKISLVFWGLSTMDLGVIFFLCIFLGLILSPTLVDFFCIRSEKNCIHYLSKYSSFFICLSAFLGTLVQCICYTISFCFLHHSRPSFTFLTFFFPACRSLCIFFLFIFQLYCLQQYLIFFLNLWAILWFQQSFYFETLIQLF